MTYLDAFTAAEEDVKLCWVAILESTIVSANGEKKIQIREHIKRYWQDGCACNLKNNGIISLTGEDIAALVDGVLVVGEIGRAHV